MIIIMMLMMMMMMMMSPKESEASGRVWRRFEARVTEVRLPRGRKLLGFTSWNRHYHGCSCSLNLV